MSEDRNAQGYRVTPGAGPRVRADVVDVYILRRPRPRAGWQVLQVRRAKDPLRATWQPVMGHIEPGETAVEAAARELREEVGLVASSPDFVGAWALEQVHPFYLAAIDCIVLSPRFVVQVHAGWEPTLNREHDAHRWVPAAQSMRFFLWPGQHAAIREAVQGVLHPRGAARAVLRVRFD